MNTLLWGPSAWRVLHATSLPAPPSTPRLIAALADALPCKYCRQSFGEFLAAMPTTPEDAVAAGGSVYAEWLYDMHNRVNNKLWRQQYAAAHTPEQYHDALVAAATLPLPVVLKRLRLGMPKACTVWDMYVLLGVMCLNASDEDKARALMRFAAALAAVVLECGSTVLAADVVRAAGNLQRYMSHLAAAENDHERIAVLLRALYGQEPVDNGPRVETETQRLAAARASGGCQHGVCH